MATGEDDGDGGDGDGGVVVMMMDRMEKLKFCLIIICCSCFMLYAGEVLHCLRDSVDA